MAQMSGQQWVFNHYNNVTQTDGYDGDGAQVKETANGADTYYLRSSVLGGAIIEELAGNGAKNVGYVYSPGGQLLAHQQSNQVTWQYTTPAGSTQLETFSNSQNSNRVEFDPLGADVSLSGPVAPDTGGGDGDIGANHLGGIMDARWSDFFNLSAGCSEGGRTASCSGKMTLFNLAAEERAWFGDGWYDLPGNNNERERGEHEYEHRLSYTFARAYGTTTLGLERGSVFPENPGFLIGRFGFNANESTRLGGAYDKITSDKCREFFDATLAALREKGEIHSRFAFTPTTLAQTLGVTSINKYSSNLNAKDVGVNADAWNNVRDKFENYQKNGIGLGVTIADGRIFLPSTAFYQAGEIAQFFYKNADLAGVITHELFHRAGLNESQLTALRDEIQRNCGTPGNALGE